MVQLVVLVVKIIAPCCLKHEILVYFTCNISWLVSSVVVSCLSEFNFLGVAKPQSLFRKFHTDDSRIFCPFLVKFPLNCIVFILSRYGQGVIKFGSGSLVEGLRGGLPSVEG